MVIRKKYSYYNDYLTTDKHSPVLNVQNTKQRVDAYVSGSWKLPLAGREVTALMNK